MFKKKGSETSEPCDDFNPALNSDQIDTMIGGYVC